MDNTRGREVSAADSAFADAVRRARQEAGLSQEDLAAEMTLRGYDFHQQTVYKIETKKRKITIGEAQALADVVGVPLSVLADSNATSIEARRARLELEVKKLLEKLVNLEVAVLDARDSQGRVRAFAEELSTLDPEDTSWPGGRDVLGFLEHLITFGSLDGWHWEWNQFLFSDEANEILDYFEALPASKRPIPGYDENHSGRLATMFFNKAQREIDG